MCVWQSHAPAGTSKFTAACGCEALAKAKRGARAVPAPAMRKSRRVVMGILLKLVAAHAAVDRDDGTGDVAREGRGEEADEVGGILGLAVLAHRDVLALFLRAALGTVVAPDLLAVDASRRNRVHRDAVPPDFARQALRPRMHRRLRGRGTI